MCGGFLLHVEISLGLGGKVCEVGGRWTLKWEDVSSTIEVAVVDLAVGVAASGVGGGCSKDVVGSGGEDGTIG